MKTAEIILNAQFDFNKRSAERLFGSNDRELDVFREINGRTIESYVKIGGT